MKFILDENLPYFFAKELTNLGLSSIHVMDVDLAGTLDERIVEYADSNNLIIITFDLDFSRILALSNSSKPSVITLRFETLSLRSFLQIIQTIIPQYNSSLEQGALITVSNDQIRIRSLPINN